MKKFLLFFLLVALFAGCENATTVKKNPNERLTMATVFVQRSPEYKALCYQAYNLATLRLRDAIKNNTEGKKLAIVLDIDETVLNNIPYQAKQVLDSIGYPTCWQEWCALEDAEPVPGVKPFLLEADASGVAIFYISNRKTKVLDETINNLKKVGLPQADADHIMLRVKDSEKETRRKKVLADGYEIVLFFGDNLSDFSADYEISDNVERNKVAESQAETFGSRFIVLPNPGYGTWTQNLGLNNSQLDQDSLVRRLISGFECK